jgi:predicted DNA repair protein MutK
VPVVHHWVETVSQSVGGVAWLMPTLLNAGVGIVAGAAVLVVVSVVGRLWRTARA